MKIKQQGFTLVEMIIYMTILAILLVVLTEVFVSVLSSQTRSEATSSVQQDGRFIFARLNYDLLRSQNIVIPVNVGDQTSNLKITIDGIDYTYSVNASGDLELLRGGSIDIINSSETQISNLLFQRLGNASGKNTIKMSFSLKSQTSTPGIGVEQKNFVYTLAVR